METLKFKTNIMCDGCIASVTPLLNSAQGINHWEVDITGKDKILTIQSNGITAEEVISELKKAGKNGELIEG